MGAPRFTKKVENQFCFKNVFLYIYINLNKYNIRRLFQNVQKIKKIFPHSGFVVSKPYGVNQIKLIEYQISL